MKGKRNNRWRKRLRQVEVKEKRRTDRGKD
jgi:hypothetical protein